MSKKWQTVELGEVVAIAARAEKPIAGKQYRQIGVRLWGQGAYEREPIDGIQTKYGQLFRAEAGDVIVNKIWARNGAVAVVPKALAGCYGSGEFPMFTPLSEQLAFEWVHWLTKSPGFWEQCDAVSRGTSGKNRIRPEQFLRVRIPLPSIPEQRRIVARLEELAAEIEEARSLRLEGAKGTAALLTSALAQLFPEDNDSSVQYTLVRDAIEGHKQGYYSSGRHTVGPVYFARISDITDDAYLDYSGMPRITIDNTALEAFRVRPNDFLFARTGGAGRFGLATKTLDCVYASYLIRFTFKQDYLPTFLRYYLRSPRFQNDIRSRIHGGVNQNVHAEDIKDASVPTISLVEQRRIVAELDALQEKVEALSQLQTETAAELNALMPSILDKAFHGEL